MLLEAFQASSMGWEAGLTMSVYWRMVFKCSYFKPVYETYLDGKEHDGVRALFGNAIKAGNYTQASLDDVRQQGTVDPLPYQGKH
jgi:hypothetical protein